MNFKLKARYTTHLRKKIDSIPGDKSISHRAVMIGALAQNSSYFTRFLDSDDCLHTMSIFQALAVPISHSLNKNILRVDGRGLKGLELPEETLYVGNSGTSIRLLTGVLAGQAFNTQITGDASIQKRPMKRVITPLSQMGAHITGQSRENSDDIYPMLQIKGNQPLHGITYTLPMASAQVKSAILLASLYSDTPTTLIEPSQSRDHTERMLKWFGADIQVKGNQITCSGKNPLQNPDPRTPIPIPADFSSAAFFIILGLLLKDSKFAITGVGLNPTRSALLTVLKAMGADLGVQNQQGENFEPYGDILAGKSTLKNIKIPEKFIPFIIDEIPILAIAALFGTGTLKISGAEELRVKESDRIATIVAMVKAMGGQIEEFKDGFELTGPATFQNFTVNSHGDHRIAMAAIIGAIASGKEAEIEDCDCINTSFPNFFDILKELGIPFELGE